MRPQMLALVALATLPALAAETRDSTVVVTATRDAKLLKEYPGSLSRIGADELQLLGATHSSEALNRMAGVFIQRGSGQESLTALRSPILTGAGSCGAFLFLEEGIPIRPVGTCNVNDLFELNTEQAGAIEIIRGPGPALYGSGAVHGIVNVLLPDSRQIPRLGTALEMGADEYRRARVSAARRTDRSAIGVVAHWTHDGGFRDESGFEERKLNALWDRQFARGQFKAWLTATDLQQDTAGFVEGYEAYRDPAIRFSNSNPEAYRDAWSARLGMHWRQPLQAGAVFSARGMVRRSRMDFLQHFLLGKPVERNGQDSVTVLLSLDAALGNTQLTFGVDGEAARSSLLEVQNGPTTDGAPAANVIRPAGRHYDFDVGSKVAAAYVQAMHPLSSTLRFTIAARAEHVRYDYDNRMIDGNTDENGLPCPGGCLYNRPVDRQDDFTRLTPKIGLLWDYAPRHQMYVNATRGYRAPETSELYRLQRQQTVADLTSESVSSLEWGTRGGFDRLHYSLAAFRMNKTHAIFRDSQGFNISDGRTYHRGAEYEFSWSFTPTLALTAAGTVARHTYDFTRTLDGGERIVSGNDVDTAPRQLHSARLRWEPVAKWETELEWISVGRYFLDAANERRYPGHELLNLRAGWQWRPQWRFTARVNNLLDRAYADRADFAFGSYRYFPGRDRSAFVEVQWRLGSERP